MSELRERALRKLEPGDRFTVKRTFDRDDTQRFGDLTRDYNPVHYERAFAEVKGFPEPILHGLLTGSMICEIGGQLAWLASGMSFEFLRPVFFGDTITCDVTLDTVDDHDRASASAVFTNHDGAVVARASLQGQLTRPQDREVLGAIVERGDTTNALRDDHRASDPDGVRIRPSVPTDAPELIALSHRVIHDAYRPILGDDAVGDYLASGEAGRFVRHNLQRSQTLVADGSVAGYAVAEGPLISLMMVDTEHQGRGLGSRLLRHMEDLLFPVHETLTLESFSANDRANRFYRDRAWTETGEMPDGQAGGTKLLFSKRRDARGAGPGV